jgi:hypothetical protein
MSAPRIIRWAYKGRAYRSLVCDEPCPECGAHALIALAGPILAEQYDGTTHVCHPSAGGCNQGFAVRFERMRAL